MQANLCAILLRILMKVFFFLAAILTLFSSYAYTNADVILNISIDGLQNVTSKSVLSVVKLKKGKCYSSVAVREDIRSILGMDYFDNVECRFDNISGNLTFVVAEKPYIERIVFNGNSEFSDENLKRVSVLKEKKYYDFSKLEETKEKINTLYRDKGCADCNVEVYTTTDVNTNKMAITFLIIENSRIIIEEIKVKGTVFFKEKEILKLMKTKLGKIFNKDVYQTDLKSIETFYKDSGFIDYKLVSSSVVCNDAKTKIFLTLDIREGNRYKMHSITYDGNSAVYNKEIEKIIKAKKNQIFKQSKIIEIINDICEFYYDRGYLGAKVVPYFNKDVGDGVIGVNLLIKEGSALYVRNIYIDGLVFTRDKIIRRELLIKPGEVLTKGNLRRSIEKIYNLGFVDNIKYQILATDKSDIVDLMISVTEGNFDVVTGGLGYSADSRFITTAQIQRMNVFGLGQKLSLSLNRELYNRKKLNYEISWTEPWVFDKNVSLVFSAFNLKKNNYYGNADVDRCKKNRVGFMSEADFRINDCMSLLFGYVYEHIDFSSLKAEIGETSEIEKTKTSKKMNSQKPTKASSVFARFAYDLRNSIFNPSRGSIYIADLTLTRNLLREEVKFVKGTVKTTWFFPTFWKFILSVNLQNSVIIPYNQSIIPTCDKFFLGGSNTIRGYIPRAEIGPANGSTVMGVMNIEYKFPIFFKEGKELIQGIIFYDVGGSWESYNSISLVLGSKRENLHSSIGFGMKIMIPVFPLKVEFGYGLNHRRRDNWIQFYSSFGDN
jgi:outer membrane protein insertion porin family